MPPDALSVQTGRLFTRDGSAHDAAHDSGISEGVRHEGSGYAVHDGRFPSGCAHFQGRRQGGILSAGRKVDASSGWKRTGRRPLVSGNLRLFFPACLCAGKHPVGMGRKRRTAGLRLYRRVGAALVCPC